MKTQQIHLELLMGKRVFALNGRPIGRLEEARSEVIRGHCYVTEFLVGSYALLERLASLSIGRAILRSLRKRKPGGYRISWEQLDLSDPERLRLRCAVDELKRLTNDQ